MCEFNDIYQRPHKAIGLPVYHSNWINHYTVMLMGHGCGVRMSTVTIPTTHSARAHMMHVLVVDACTAWNSTLWYTVCLYPSACIF